MKGTFRIKTDKFKANGAVYAAMDGSETVNTVTDKETVINFELSNHQILILKKIATKGAGKYYAVLKRNIPRKIAGDNEELIVDKNNITRIEYSPYIIIPQNSWPDKLVFGRGQTIESAIIVAPEDIPALAGAELNLSTYYEYYNVRKRYNKYRLWDMGERWNKALRVPIFNPNRSLDKKYKVIFVLGEKAREKYFPEGNVADSIVQKVTGNCKIVGFFPGKLSEKELIYQLLNMMDKNHPYIGVITDRWSIDAKFYGKVFESKKQKNGKAIDFILKRSE
jgi:hypothetical protein